MFRRSLSVFVLVLPFAAAADPSPIVLWKDIAVGDAPEAVVSKLEKYPFVKAAKVKGHEGQEGAPVISVKYRGDGIDILGTPYQLDFTFEHGAVRRIALASGPACADRAIEQFAEMSRALAEKYPQDPLHADGRDQKRVEQAYRDGTDDKPATAQRYFSDGSVVVLYQQRFTAEMAPPSGYTANARVGALEALLWNQYAARVRECNGTGNHRLQQILIYLTKEDFEEAKRDFDAHDAARIGEARSNL